MRRVRPVWFQEGSLAHASWEIAKNPVKREMSTQFSLSITRVIISRAAHVISYRTHPQKQPTSNDRAADTECRTASTMHGYSYMRTQERRGAHNDANTSHVLRLPRAWRGPRDAPDRYALRWTPANRAAACAVLHMRLCLSGPKLRSHSAPLNELRAALATSSSTGAATLLPFVPPFALAIQVVDHPRPAMHGRDRG